VSGDVGGGAVDDETAGEDPRAVYRGYRPRPELIPITNGLVDPTKSVDYLLSLVGSAPSPPVEENAEMPFIGVTTEGQVLPGLFPIEDEGFDPQPVVAAANAYLAALPASDRARASRAIDATEWRLWTNAFAREPHGVLLEQMSDPAREAALALLQESLSTRGFAEVREAMALNGALATLLGQYADSLTEWMYWLTIFGSPSVSEPWGWQLSGHHVDLNCLILGPQMVLTPSFLGAEFDSDRIFADQRHRAIELISSLSPRARDQAILYPSMRADDLPVELAGRVDGRHLGGAGQDNRVVPYVGVRGDALTPGQRELLLALSDTFTIRLPPGPAARRRHAIESHLVSTYFSWIGEIGPASPFYFRIHSPVVLAEYDNHPGIFLDFDEPEPFHVHTVVRTPNGNDYGKDLLRAHYEVHHR
jgi:hypothetical protein